MSATNTRTARPLTKKQGNVPSVLPKGLIGKEIEVEFYCSKVCGAKCCSVWFLGSKIGTCPKLTADCKCSIYEDRFIKKKPFRFTLLNGTVRARCSEILKIIQRGELAPEIKQQCCFAHPEVLDMVKNWQIEAYKEGRLEEIPESLLPEVKARASAGLPVVDTGYAEVVEDLGGESLPKTKKAK